MIPAISTYQTTQTVASGYIDHACPEDSRREMLDGIEIINMPAPSSKADSGNGRIEAYPVLPSNNGNPVIARFCSPDPEACLDERSDRRMLVPDFTQNYNRYSYVMNNPLVF